MEQSILGWSDARYGQLNNESILKKDILIHNGFLFFNKSDDINIVWEKVCIDLNCFSSDRYSILASC